MINQGVGLFHTDKKSTTARNTDGACARALHVATQPSVQNIKANAAILRDLEVVPLNIIEQLEQMAIQHAQNTGR